MTDNPLGWLAVGKLEGPITLGAGLSMTMWWTHFFDIAEAAGGGVVQWGAFVFRSLVAATIGVWLVGRGWRQMSSREESA